MDGRRPRPPSVASRAATSARSIVCAGDFTRCWAGSSGSRTWCRENTRKGARRHISAHYDLGNRLFESFLDQRMQYSAAVFSRPRGEPRRRRSWRSSSGSATALDLGPDDHLLEIGTGWGGLAIHAAETRGCRVTTTTISREQHAYAAERIRERGLAERIELLLTDYRDLTGSYDKLVSIEMIEAVGWQYFGEFFAKCAALTRPGGAMFLQAIVIGDEAYEAEKAAPQLRQQAHLPRRLPAVAGADLAGWAPRTGSRSSAAKRSPTTTRARWRSGAIASTTPGRRCDRTATTSGSSRLWNFYLAFSEGGFRERRIRDLQIVLAKPGRRPEEARWRSPTRERAAASLSS